MSFNGGGMGGYQPPRMGPGTSSIPDWLKTGAQIGGGALATAGVAGLIGKLGGGGQMVTGSQMPSDITGLRQQVIGWLGGTPTAQPTQPIAGVALPGGITFNGGLPRQLSQPAMPVTSPLDRIFTGAAERVTPGIARWDEIQPLGPTNVAQMGAADINMLLGRDRNVQSLADIVNGNQGVVNTVLPGFQSLFDQERGRALAQAREASGNLTGSGYANNLATSLERLVPGQQAQLSNVVMNLANTELGRQMGLAQLASSEAVNQAGRNDAASQFNAAATNNMGQFDVQNLMQILMANATGRAQANQFNIGNQLTADTTNAGNSMTVAQNNANRYFNLLNALVNGGVSSGQMMYQPGFADQFAQLIPAFAQLAGRRTT